MAFEFVKTGIKGLDSMLGGGIPKGQSVLLVGGPGTGKTSVALQFLYEGALNGEKGLFISLEEKPERIVENCMIAFPEWKQFRKLVGNETIKILKIEKWSYDGFIETINTNVSQYKATRCVIDSLSIMELYFEKAYDYRKRLFDMINFLSNTECTTLITSEMEGRETIRLRHPIAEYVADGVIALYKLEKKEKRVRALEILKMRGTSHMTDLVPIAIEKNGIKVFEGEKVY